MNSINTLTFSQGRQTNSRRVSAVPQLKCVGGDAQYDAPQHVHAVQCQKVGQGYGNDIQWKCEADLPIEYRLGETMVSCEGYDHSNDADVLEGSCGLEYTLYRTGQTSPNNYHSWSGGAGSDYHRPSHSASSRRSTSWSGGWLGYAVLAGLAYACFGGSSMIFWCVAAYIASSVLGVSMLGVLGLALIVWMCGGRRSSGFGNNADYNNAGYGYGSYGSGYGDGYRGGYGGGYGGNSGSFFGGLAAGAAGAAASTLFGGSRRSHASSHSSFFGSNAARSSTSRSRPSSARHRSSGYGGTRNR